MSSTAVKVPNDYLNQVGGCCLIKEFAPEDIGRSLTTGITVRTCVVRWAPFRSGRFSGLISAPPDLTTGPVCGQTYHRINTRTPHGIFLLPPPSS